MNESNEGPQPITINGREFARLVKLKDQKWIVVWTCIECGTRGTVARDSAGEAIGIATQHMNAHGLIPHGRTDDRLRP